MECGGHYDRLRRCEVIDNETLRRRIQRAIEAIRAANRYSLCPNEVLLVPDETGNLTQACVLDDVAAILEGVDNDETE